MMLRQPAKKLSAVCVVLLLSACASVSTVQEGFYSPEARYHLYNLHHWNLEGRIAITAPNDSWSANIQWLHLPNSEVIRLSGPLGQGGVVIELKDGSVKLDRGGGNVQISNDPEQFVNQQLGMFVPIQSLRFWAVGLPEPEEDFQATVDGFVQDKWLITYKEFQDVLPETLPHKMAVSNNHVKLKLIIDQWNLNEDKAN